jgi:hypothetical protein
MKKCNVVHAAASTVTCVRRVQLLSCQRLTGSPVAVVGPRPLQLSRFSKEDILAHASRNMSGRAISS